MVLQTVLVWVLVVVAVLSIAVFLYALRVRLDVNDGLFDPVLQSEKRLDGLYAIVTGGNRGIGYETALALAKRGCQVTIACRNELKGKRAERQINDRLLREFGESQGKVLFSQCDLSKLSTVKRFIKEYEKSGQPLHFLINNAGMGGSRFKVTGDGVELVMQINYLSHFLITHELLPLMVRSARKSELIGRIVNVSSVWHKHGNINLNLWKSEPSVQKKAWHWKSAYGTSKLAQILHASYLQSKVLNEYDIPVSIFSVHPGGVDTDIFRIGSQPWLIQMIFLMMKPCYKFAMRSPEMGAQTSLHCIVSDFKQGLLEPGKYHSSNKVGITNDPRNQSNDNDMMKELYEWSMNTLQLDDHDYPSLLSQREI